jgi:hypothetical protein
LKAAAISCPRCSTPFPPESFNTRRFFPCRKCGALLEVSVFPAFFRASEPGKLPEAVLTGAEPGCFFHPQKRAVVPCDGCGRFLCALCEVEWKGQHLCPACLESGRSKGKLQELQTHRLLYDNIALGLAILPLLFFPVTIVTAPATLFLSVWAWNRPGSIAPRTRFRFVLAFAIALLQVAGWVVGLFFYFAS